MPRFCEQCGEQLNLNPSPADAPTILAEHRTFRAADTATETRSDDRIIGRYRLGKSLGHGGMGVVYEATEIETGRRVALKLLSSGLARDKSAVDRFVREGQLAAQVSHPRTTFIYEAGEHTGQPFIVMELMPGRTLEDELTEQGHLPVGRAVDHILDVIDGLIAAHQLDVIHRDVKPSNCFLDTDGRVKVGDFGLSKSLVTDVSLTRTGSFMGTPLYAAPEQIRGGPVDQRTDVYAVGATLFTLIAGKPAFEGDAMSVTAQIVSDAAPSLRSQVDKVPRALDRIVARTLAKDPDARFQTLGDLRHALLPFSHRHRSLVEVARRSAAYMIDYLMISTLVQVVSGLAGAYIGARSEFLGDPESLGSQVSTLIFISGVIGWVGLFVYFAVGDGCFGRTLGKRLMKLRVVDADGQPPGMWRGCVRSFIIPGALAIPMIGLLLRFNLNPDALRLVNMELVMRSWLFDRATEWLPVLICLITMRHTNGLRGIHGIVSGTRVIRIDDLARRNLWIHLPTLEARPVTEDAPETIGPFRIRGVLAREGPVSVLLAKDESLDREAWIFRFPTSLGTLQKRADVNRHGRLRCLQHGEIDGDSWYAYQTVDGAQFSHAAGQTDLFCWENTRQAVLDLACELRASLGDGSLPQQLSIDQFWIERSGAGKLLERPLPSSAGSGSELTGDEPAEQRAYHMLDSVFQLILEKQILPERVRQFIAEFAARPKNAETISWIVEQLEASSEKLASINWDTRLGVLGATVGIEWVVFSGFTLFSMYFYFAAIGLLPIWKMIVPVVVLSLVFFAIGYWLRGGPVFQFMTIDVQNRQGGLASRWRCGFRNLIAWLPLAVCMSCTAALAAVSFDLMERRQNENSNQLISEEAGLGIEQDSTIMLTLAVIAVVFNLVMYVGALYSIVRPQRGIQDLMVGTRLVPK